MSDEILVKFLLSSKSVWNKFIFLWCKQKRFTYIFVKLRRKFLLGSIGLDEQLRQLIFGPISPTQITTSWESYCLLVSSLKATGYAWMVLVANWITYCAVIIGRMINKWEWSDEILFVSLKKKKNESKLIFTIISGYLENYHFRKSNSKVIFLEIDS